MISRNKAVRLAKAENAAAHARLHASMRRIVKPQPAQSYQIVGNMFLDDAEYSERMAKAKGASSQ